MNILFSRYSHDMLIAISNQAIVSIAINSVSRAVVFTLVLQLLAYFSVGQISSLLQMLVLVLVFSFIVFSVDLIERTWAQHALTNRR